MVSGALLLDSGNFVILGTEGKSETIWESFGQPTDTLLPGMKLGGDRKLISWKNSFDPAPGVFSFDFQTDSSGGAQLMLRWNDSVPYWKSGAWNGEVFVGIPEMSGTYTYDFSVEDTGSVIYFVYRILAGRRILPRFVMDKTGGLLLYSLIDGNRWNMIFSKPVGQCEVYGLCGTFGICDSNSLQPCSCPREFKPRDEKDWDSQERWSSGCVRRNPINCDAKNGTYSHPAQTGKQCKNSCLYDSSCIAFKYMGNLCQIWSGNLLNMRSSRPKNDSVLFVRVAASQGRRSKIALVVGVVVACAVVFTILACLFWRKCWVGSNQGCSHAFAACLGLRFTMGSLCTRPEANEDDGTASIRMFIYKELQIANKKLHS